MSSRRYVRPSSLDEALAALSAGGTLVAGGTDFYPARVGKALAEDVVDLTAIAELRGIAEAADHWRLGATTTWTDLLQADLPPLFDGLKLAAREVGGVQIQNAGTLAGNLCNASPAADGAPPLLALDAKIELLGGEGGERRLLPLADFITGNRQTARQAGQIVTAILVPKPERPAASHFLKLGARKYLVISIVMVAACIERDAQGRIAKARVALGACAPLAKRLPALEAALIGQEIARAASIVAPEHFAPLRPIDDVRGSAEYRLDAALTLTRRCLSELGERM